MHHFDSVVWIFILRIYTNICLGSENELYQIQFKSGTGKINSYSFSEQIYTILCCFLML